MLRSVTLKLRGGHHHLLPHNSSWSSFDSGFNSNSTEKYHERKILPYAQEQMYNVVADVESYKHFLPYCSQSRVLSKTVTNDEGDGVIKLQGELTVAFMGIEETYISDVKCRPNELVQAVASTGTPLFKSLMTTWSFQPASVTSPHPTANITETLQKKPHTTSALTSTHGPTLVTFDLEFAFANPLYAHLSSKFSSKVAKLMIDAFERRCLHLYGPGTE
ncbi:hypothetical protein Clacol_001242 [Clathrus columnatus]|uniref:Coenzyme Q-binding protein COQ10 START domain-containing protein n=1 Tax=Clathrus columnatus TaxID=1419009 RepID=A0AAV5A2S9_9AGAM|nr:hypothetical protein Clacol_001242 [Clathrus columnatus]